MSLTKNQTNPIVIKRHVTAIKSRMTTAAISIYCYHHANTLTERHPSVVDLIVAELLQQRVGDLGETEPLLRLYHQRDYGDAVEDDRPNLELENTRHHPERNAVDLTWLGLASFFGGVGGFASISRWATGMTSGAGGSPGSYEQPHRARGLPLRVTPRIVSPGLCLHFSPRGGPIRRPALN